MSDYYTTANYGSMLRDRLRIDAYLEALQKVIVPGETTVLELGTGTGVVALVAARAGAKRVVALEPNSSISVAREIAADNGLSDQIEFIQAMSTDIDLEPSDVIISDMRGGLPLLEYHVPSIVDARERLLKPGGTLIAQADRIYAAPVEAREPWKEYVGHWDDAPMGFDMSAAKRSTANTSYHFAAEPEALLADASLLATLEYSTIQSPHMVTETVFEARRSGDMHGLSVWFETQLDDEVMLSNAPGQPMLAYGRPFFPITRPIKVETGDEVELKLSAHLVMGRYVWRWRGGVVGDSSRAFEHSTFQGLDATTTDLALYRTDRAPALSVRGERVRWVLDAVDGGTSLGAITERMAAEHDDLTTDQAMAFVSDVLSRYGVRSE